MAKSKNKMKTCSRNKKGFTPLEKTVRKPLGSLTGFTLVETLLVVCTVGFLLAIMLPVAGKARSVAKRAVCINNLRQLYFAMLSYVENHNGTYPAGSFSIGSLLPYMGNNKENTKCPAIDKYYDVAIISYGYNGNLAGARWARAKTPLQDTMLFCDSGSAVVLYKNEPALNRHGKNIGLAVYTDGHIGYINTEYLSDGPH
jgi:type II secretory pathway pseudopilin PulG